MLDSNHLSPKEKQSAHELGDAPVSPPVNRLELMDVRGLAEFLCLDRQTIYNWLHQHKLTGIKVGGVWRFDRRAIEAWLQAQTVVARATPVTSSRGAMQRPPEE